MVRTGRPGHRSATPRRTRRRSGASIPHPPSPWRRSRRTRTDGACRRVRARRSSDSRIHPSGSPGGKTLIVSRAPSSWKREGERLRDRGQARGRVAWASVIVAGSVSIGGCASKTAAAEVAVASQQRSMADRMPACGDVARSVGARAWGRSRRRAGRRDQRPVTTVASWPEWASSDDTAEPPLRVVRLRVSSNVGATVAASQRSR